MSETITIPECANCFHSKENHFEKGVCNGDLTCRCDHYVEPFLYAFAQRVEKEKYLRKSIKKRCEYILQNIPQTRNAGEKTFYRIFLEVWYGFKIRVNNPQVMDKKIWDRIPNAESVGREKRRCKQWNEELKTYSPKVIWEQTAIFQALLEMSVEEK